MNFHFIRHLWNSLFVFLTHNSFISDTIYTNGTKKLWDFKIATYIQEWSKIKIYVEIITSIFNFPSSPAYCVFISQLVRYARACPSYECFILRALRLSNKLLGQGYVKERLKPSLWKFYGRYGDLIKRYDMIHDILDDDHIQRDTLHW